MFERIIENGTHRGIVGSQFDITVVLCNPSSPSQSKNLTLNNDLIGVFIYIDAWRNWAMVHQRGHGRGQEMRPSPQKGIRDIKDICKYTF